MAWYEVPLAMKVLEWLHGWAGRRLEKRRQESEAARERLIKCHELLTIWRKTYPQVVELMGLMKEALDSPRVTPDKMQQLTDVVHPPTAALVKNTPNLSAFIAANSLLLPEEVTARLKEIEGMADMAPIMLGQVKGEARAEALRKKCDELLEIIEHEYKGAKKGD